jgi:hypothetical protein
MLRLAFGATEDTLEPVVLRIHAEGMATHESKACLITSCESARASYRGITASYI